MKYIMVKLTYHITSYRDKFNKYELQLNMFIVVLHCDTLEYDSICVCDII